MPAALEPAMARGGPAVGKAGVTVRIRYFAILREERGREEEALTTGAASAAELLR